MRTTLTLDDDLLLAAKTLAEAKAVSIGKVISDLAKKGLNLSSKTTYTKNDFPIFSVKEDAQPITLEHVKKLEDEI